VDIDALGRRHNQRVTSLDPLLPPLGPLSAPDGSPLFTATAGDSAAAGAVRFRNLDPESLTASWGALRTHTLSVRAAGPDPSAALTEVLGQWDEHLRALVEPGDEETSATVNIASQDTPLAAALVRRGFAPMIACSARPVADRGPAAPPAGVAIRPVTEADLAVATELFLVDIEWDAAFLTATVRPSTAPGVHQLLAELVADQASGAWLAERDGQAIGLVTLELPPLSDWITEETSAAPAAYLGLLAVRPEHRGGGVGSALVRAAEQASLEHGMAVTVLHHVLPNPLSTPFWFSRGFRPLWTHWLRRPAVPLR
jgi:GNAT superfamily N-acetyltransferase